MAALAVFQALVHPIHPGSLFFVILFFCSPETDLQGDHHLGVVDPHDVPQVQLAVHHQSIIVSAGPLVFLGVKKVISEESGVKLCLLRGTSRDPCPVP